MDGFEIKDKDRLPVTEEKKCLTCGHPIRITAFAQTLYFGCPACGHLYNVKGSKVKVNKIFTKSRSWLVLPIGSRGKLNGIQYEVIGFNRCREKNTQYKWAEYYLFNPIHGYRILSEFGGHWMLLQQVYDFPRNLINLQSIEYQGKYYNIYHKYETVIDSVAGEVNFDVTSKETPKVREYIAPPHILVREQTASEICWFHGEYVNAEEVSSAFQNKKPLPEQIGIGSIQPFIRNYDKDTFLLISLLAVVLLLSFQFLFRLITPGGNVFYKRYELQYDSSGNKYKEIVTESFHVKGNFNGYANLEISINAPELSNDWFELSGTLVNETTGEEYSFEHGVEYYAGYDGGESWTEGSRNTSKFLSSIPEGKYHFNLFPFKGKNGDAWTDQTFAIYFTVEQNVNIWSNLILIILAISIYPAIQMYRSHYFEVNRWMNSNYSPYE